jgi:hypothetical protein
MLYEQRLLDGLSQGGDKVLLFDMKTESISRLKQVQDDLYDETVDRGSYRRRPDKVRDSWIGIGVSVAVAEGLLTAALAIFSGFRLLGLQVIFGGMLVAIRAGPMPRRGATRHRHDPPCDRIPACPRHLRGRHRALGGAARHLLESPPLPRGIRSDRAMGQGIRWSRRRIHWHHGITSLFSPVHDV